MPIGPVSASPRMRTSVRPVVRIACASSVSTVAGIRGLVHSQGVQRPAAQEDQVGPSTETAAPRMPLFLSEQEAAVNARASMRYVAFLRDELEEIPSWHPLHGEYRAQLESLSRRLRRRGPRPASPSSDG